MNAAVFSLSALLFAAASLQAQELEADSLRISIEVSVPDENVRDRTTKYLTEELQLLGDVVVDDENPDFKLFAVLMQVRTSRGTRMAYVLAVSVASFIPDGYLDYVLDDRLANIKDVRNDMSSATIYENQFVSLAGPTEQNLQEVARNTVTKFDRHVLRLARNSRLPASVPQQ